jgi:hypothetical protein
MTNSILGSLMQQLQGGGIGEISKAVGVSEDQVGQVVSGALPALMGALGRNAGSPSGAEALFGALSGKHDGGILNDVVGALAGGKSADTGILRHAFGAKQGAVEQALSSGSGVDMASVTKILAMVAPLVMGALGKARQEQGLDTSSMASMIDRERQTAEKQAPGVAGMLGSLLDSDGDGDVMDDVASIGSSLFKSFLG